MSPSLMLRRQRDGWVPSLWPHTPSMLLWGCHNRDPQRAGRCGLKRLDQLDAQARRQLDIRPLPAPTPSQYTDWPEACFMDVTEIGAP